ncbi:unnamed protein product [Ambrosiozyma monospora]|uniref:Unnamed protein product n=1 Tax=Ambrosiozyma monospora TaxID=43982 RepID=A0A9W6YSW4_AMBMO|nr:unnamed protein product [Ambrosiozyma monospora]
MLYIVDEDLTTTTTTTTTTSWRPWPMAPRITGDLVRQQFQQQFQQQVQQQQQQFTSKNVDTKFQQPGKISAGPKNKNNKTYRNSLELLIDLASYN